MNKACPVVLRQESNGAEFLAFEHPFAGKQLVKGTIESGESLGTACTRELAEESGVKAIPSKFLGQWDANFDNQIWGFYLMEYDNVLPDSWEHFTRDDGGHIFTFFWQPLNKELGSDWHPLFSGAVNYIRYALATNYVDLQT